MNALADASALPRISVVVPAYDEAPSLPDLVRRTREALADRSYEIVIVDDGSRDDTWRVVGELAREDGAVRGVRLRRNFGKAAALAAGFGRARGAVVVTMDADLQNDPADIPELLARLDAGADLVVGWRQRRVDPIDRRVLSRIFNAVVRASTGLRLHDVNSGMKAFRREVIRTVPVYEGLFRYIPVVAAWEGFAVTEVAVRHHRRRHGASRYGLGRVYRGTLDLLSVLFLTRYAKQPMHFFGVIGALLALVGFGIDIHLTILWFQGHKIGDRPLLLLGVLLLIVGVQFFSIGLLGEYLTYQQQRQRLGERAAIREQLDSGVGSLEARDGRAGERVGPTHRPSVTEDRPEVRGVSGPVPDDEPHA